MVAVVVSILLAADAARIIDEIHAERAVHVFGELVVFLDTDATRAADHKRRMDDHAGSEFASDATIVTGTPAQLADLLIEWRQAGLTGFRLRPAALPHDLAAISGGLVPELQRRGVFRTAYEAGTLRGLLGLSAPANRYAGSAKGTG